MTVMSSLSRIPIFDTHAIPILAPMCTLPERCQSNPSLLARLTGSCSWDQEHLLSPRVETHWHQAPPTCWTPPFYNHHSSPRNLHISKAADGGKDWTHKQHKTQESGRVAYPSASLDLAYSISFPCFLLDIWDLIGHMMQASEFGG